MENVKEFAAFVIPAAKEKSNVPSAPSLGILRAKFVELSANDHAILLLQAIRSVTVTTVVATVAESKGLTSVPV